MVKIKNKLFRDIFEKDQLHTMAHLLTRQYYTKGDTILRQGEVGDFLSIVRSGEIGIYMREIPSQGPIAMQGKGYIFGERALLEDDERPTTVVAAR
jgi:CRP-like cAMP-binding protein